MKVQEKTVITHSKVEEIITEFNIGVAAKK
jgi:hypothetical protein